MPWDSYGDTILRFPGAGLHLDLRHPVGEPERKELRRLGLSGTFSVVTACNPLGGVLEPSANRRLSAQLDSVVLRQWPDARRADGDAPDGTHSEAGWALSGPIEPARALAARFFQRALFWYDGDRFYIVPVLAPGPILSLPGQRKSGLTA
jgi:hypothetical protein